MKSYIRVNVYYAQVKKDYLSRGCLRIWPVGGAKKLSKQPGNQMIVERHKSSVSRYWIPLIPYRIAHLLGSRYRNSNLFL